LIVGRDASEAFGLFGIDLFSVWDITVAVREVSVHVDQSCFGYVAWLVSSSNCVFELPVLCPYRLLWGVVAQIMHVLCQRHDGQTELRRNRVCAA